MNKDWEILTLGGYLAEEQFPQGLPRGTTFARTFAETSELPPVTVGLGLLRGNSGRSSFIVDLVPPIKHSQTVMLNSFINEVAEQYIELSETIPDQWQEAILLKLGYVKKSNHGPFTPTSNYHLFSSIPDEERLSLLREHGFHKIATVVSYGFTEDIGSILASIDKTNKELPEKAGYGTIMNLFSVGVPVEDWSLAIQLPEEMVAEFYGDDAEE